jgi:hypothetical protein
LGFYTKKGEDKMDLQEIELEILQIREELEIRKEIYDQETNLLNAKLNEAIREKLIILHEYNLEKILIAETIIFVTGFLKYYGEGSTINCLEDCIADVAKGFEKLRKCYFGCKNYSSWSCQRCDCQYGEGPSHGDIVFRIELRKDYRNKDVIISKDDTNAVLYYLENLKKADFRGIVLKA